MKSKMQISKLENKILVETFVEKSGVTRNFYNINNNYENNLGGSCSQTVILDTHRGPDRGLPPLPHNVNYETVSNFHFVYGVKIKFPILKRFFTTLSADSNKLFMFKSECQFEPTKPQSESLKDDKPKLLANTTNNLANSANNNAKLNDSLAETNDPFTAFKIMVPVALQGHVEVLARISCVVHQNAHYFLIITIFVIVYKYLLSNDAQIEKRENTLCNVVLPSNFFNSHEKIKFETYYFRPTFLIGSFFIHDIFIKKKKEISKKELARLFCIARSRLHQNLAKISNLGLLISISLIVYPLYFRLLGVLLQLLKLYYEYEFSSKYYQTICLFVGKNEIFFTLVFYVAQSCCYFYLIYPWLNKKVIKVTHFLTKQFLILIYILNNIKIKIIQICNLNYLNFKYIKKNTILSKYSIVFFFNVFSY